MTGAEFRVMKFTDTALAVLMMVVAGNVQGAITTSATLDIDVTFTQPSCNISVPASYNLGLLTPGDGEKSHSPLTITWVCEGAEETLATALTASIVKGTPNGGTGVTLLSDDGADTGATLSLKEGSGSLIKLLTSGTDVSSDDYFCSGTGTLRTCALIPVTSVSARGPFGMAYATLRLEIRYP
ncbi:F18 fimbrial protein FedE [Salmonella enterica]|nr:F18 fimbrial protein FedE [Salmonella enterica]